MTELSEGSSFALLEEDAAESEGNPVEEADGAAAIAESSDGNPDALSEEAVAGAAGKEGKVGRPAPLPFVAGSCGNPVGGAEDVSDPATEANEGNPDPVPEPVTAVKEGNRDSDASPEGAGGTALVKDGRPEAVEDPLEPGKLVNEGRLDPTAEALAAPEFPTAAVNEGISEDGDGDAPPPVRVPRDGIEEPEDAEELPVTAPRDGMVPLPGAAAAELFGIESMAANEGIPDAPAEADAADPVAGTAAVRAGKLPGLLTGAEAAADKEGNPEPPVTSTVLGASTTGLGIGVVAGPELASAVPPPSPI